MMTACYKWCRENKFLVIFLQLSLILKLFFKKEKKERENPNEDDTKKKTTVFTLFSITEKKER